MAGFGAGFARALGTSLDAAGKSHLEEQRRAREYEKAKADRQAERLEDRAWQQEDADTRRKQQIEDRDLEQGIKDEADWTRYSEKGDKIFYTRRDGTVVEVAKGSPGANGYFRDKKEAGQKDTLFGLTVSEKKANIRQSDASAAASNARARADSGKLPDDVYAQMQFELKPVISRYDNIDKKTQGIIARAQQDNANPKLPAAQRKANNDLIAEAKEMRRSLLSSQKALSAQYVASGFQADPLDLFSPRAEELKSKFPNAWGRFAALNAQEVQDRRTSEDARRAELYKKAGNASGN